MDATKPIRLAYHGSLARLLPALLVNGRSEADFEFLRYEVSDPFAVLRSGAADVLVVKFVPREADLAWCLAPATDQRAVAVGNGHPLAGRDSVSIEEVAAYRAFRKPPGLPGYIWDEMVPPRTPRGRPIDRGEPAESTPQLLEVVASGRAVHISLLSLADAAPEGVRLVPVHDLPPAPVVLAWRQGRYPAHVPRFIADVQRAPHSITTSDEPRSSISAKKPA